MNKINAKGLSPFVSAENELRNAAEALKIGNHGKARVCSRRAVGMVVDYYLKNNEKLRPIYGNSFMNNVRGIAADSGIPQKIKSLAEKLIAHTGPDEISGDESIDYANRIIEFYKGKISDSD